MTHVVAPDTIYLQRLGMHTADEDDTLQEAVIQLERLQHMTEFLNNPSSELRSLAETDITPGYCICSVFDVRILKHFVPFQACLVLVNTAMTICGIRRLQSKSG